MSEEFEYEEEQHDDTSFEGTFLRILNTVKKGVRVQYAAKIIKVNSQDSVNIEYYSNGVADILQNVPVRHLKSPTGFFILKLKEGDRGIVRFFDDDIDLYRTSGVIAESSEVKVHDINDNIFEIGFYPDNENYIYPDGDLVIGTNAGGIISITDSEIVIKSKINVKIDSPSVETTGAFSAGNGLSAMIATQSGILNFTNGILTSKT